MEGTRARSRLASGSAPPPEATGPAVLASAPDWSGWGSGPEPRTRRKRVRAGAEVAEGEENADGTASSSVEVTNEPQSADLLHSTARPDHLTKKRRHIDVETDAQNAHIVGDRAALDAKIDATRREKRADIDASNRLEYMARNDPDPPEPAPSLPAVAGSRTPEPKSSASVTSSTDPSDSADASKTGAPPLPRTARPARGQSPPATTARLDALHFDRSVQFKQGEVRNGDGPLAKTTRADKRGDVTSGPPAFVPGWRAAAAKPAVGSTASGQGQSPGSGTKPATPMPIPANLSILNTPLANPSALTSTSTSTTTSTTPAHPWPPLPPAVRERVENLELHLNIPPVPGDVYARIKRLEDRILEVERTNPELAAAAFNETATAVAHQTELAETAGRTGAATGGLMGVPLPKPAGVVGPAGVGMLAGKASSAGTARVPSPANGPPEPGVAKPVKVEGKAPSQSADALVRNRIAELRSILAMKAQQKQT